MVMVPELGWLGYADETMQHERKLTCSSLNRCNASARFADELARKCGDAAAAGMLSGTPCGNLVGI